MRILFQKIGSFSHINNQIPKVLSAQYPEASIDVLDVWDIVKHKVPYYHFLINIYFFLKEYGIDILSRKKHFKDAVVWFFATSYISIVVSRTIKKLNTGKKYDFTFQTQSLYNCKLEGIPHFIYTDHTTQTNLLYPDIDPKQYMRSRRFIEKSETKMYQDATMIFTFGSLISYSLLNQYKIPKEKVVTVFAGNNLLNGYIENSNKGHSKNILFVGKSWERKGGPILVEVFQNILKRYPDASLTIVGCKPDNISLPNCNVIGNIPIADVSKYYNLANIFCLPTLREPFGNVFLEAMNFRLPIIANNIGSLPDLVTDDFNGYLIKNNVTDYTEAIFKLFANPEKSKKMGENGYQRAQSKFTWEVVGKTMKSNIDKWI